MPTVRPPLSVSGRAAPRSSTAPASSSRGRSARAPCRSTTTRRTINPVIASGGTTTTLQVPDDGGNYVIGNHIYFDDTTTFQVGATNANTTADACAQPPPTAGLDSSGRPLDRPEPPVTGEYLCGYTGPRLNKTGPGTLNVQVPSTIGFTNVNRRHADHERRRDRALTVFSINNGSTLTVDNTAQNVPNRLPETASGPDAMRDQLRRRHAQLHRCSGCAFDRAHGDDPPQGRSGDDPVDAGRRRWDRGAHERRPDAERRRDDQLCRRSARRSHRSRSGPPRPTSSSSRHRRRPRPRTQPARSPRWSSPTAGPATPRRRGFRSPAAAARSRRRRPRSTAAARSPGSSSTAPELHLGTDRHDQSAGPDRHGHGDDQYPPAAMTRHGHRGHPGVTWVPATRPCPRSRSRAAAPQPTRPSPPC